MPNNATLSKTVIFLVEDVKRKEAEVKKQVLKDKEEELQVCTESGTDFSKAYFGGNEPKNHAFIIELKSEKS